MYLILHQMDEFHHIHTAHCHRFVECFAGASIIERHLSRDWRSFLLLSVNLLCCLLQFLITHSGHAPYSLVFKPEHKTSPPGLAIAIFIKYLLAVKTALVKPDLSMFHGSGVWSLESGVWSPPPLDS
ncbi:MAG: hypothetical protein DDT27_00148 [Dehalococcoidia bacterium]|nr:hypothetical protein [Chloroflexota bacterium]